MNTLVFGPGRYPLREVFAGPSGCLQCRSFAMLGSAGTSNLPISLENMTVVSNVSGS